MNAWVLLRLIGYIPYAINARLQRAYYNIVAWYRTRRNPGLNRLRRLAGIKEV